MSAGLRFSNSRVVFARGSLGPVQGIFCSALLVRLWALSRFTYSAAINPSGSDMLFYQQWAQRILAGQGTDHHAFYGLPLYAYYLAAIYRIFGVAPFVPLLLQAVADA